MNERSPVNSTIGILKPSTPIKYSILKWDIQESLTVNGESTTDSVGSKLRYYKQHKTSWTPVVTSAIHL